MGFENTYFIVREGDAVEVCVTVLFPNETVLNLTNIHGQFYIEINNGNCDN